MDEPNIKVARPEALRSAWGIRRDSTPFEDSGRATLQKHSSRSKSDLICLLGLVLLATLIRAWLLCHTEVTSRDSIGFERYAWELQNKNWISVLHDNVHHPLYPITILGVSAPIRYLVGGSELEVMQSSAQLASGLAGILLVIPMFYLGKEIFDRRVGFWAAAIFQCLPVGARVMSDALSESLFLLTTATALLLAIRAFHSGSTKEFLACGLCAGLAYLTRPEGILIVAAVGVVFVGRRLFVDRKIFWTQTAKQLAALALSTAVLAGPYMVIIQGFSNKTTTKDILKSEIRNQKIELAATDETQNKHGNPSVFPPCSIRGCFSDFRFRISNFAIWWPDGKVSDLPGHLWWSVYALASEISKGFFYVVWIPAILGLWMLRSRLKLWSGETLLLILCLLQCLALLRVAMVAGYVADRHVLVIVMCGLYWAAAYVLSLPDLSGVPFLPGKLCLPPFIVFVVLIGAALPKTLEPLHTNRAGHRAIGLWLAKHLTPGDEVDDAFSWATHYAGRTFCDDPGASVPGCNPRYRYVVHDCRPDHRDQFRKHSTPIHNLVAAGGEVVYHWPEQVPLEEAQIVLFAVPLAPNK
ncbi:MAG TPA: glycosyltransferase family 39 protein [Gemmataceae bacterium]|jgi:4-amino-4-deoxy-L-arabinose transferase-like glycosyltransferase|nr:glycosyltransferase family 39 protein [Gemmataceae bacterium]